MTYSMGGSGKLKVPVIFMHGSGDPRTEQNEMARVQRALPRAEMRFVETGRHSPHSERKSWKQCNRDSVRVSRGKIVLGRTSAARGLRVCHFYGRHFGAGRNQDPSFHSG